MSNNSEIMAAIEALRPDPRDALIASLREQLKDAQQLNRDHEEVHADKRRLVREIDVIMNGDGAAKQASLCDLVHQIEALVRDSKRFAWCQDNWFKAQALFWNHSSRKDRAKEIDLAIKASP